MIFASDTYIPILTSVSNLAAITPYTCLYFRIGTVVLVAGTLDITTSLAGSTKCGISLPVMSQFAISDDCSGVAFSPGIAGLGAAILADVVNGRAQLQFMATGIITGSLYFIFAYRVM